MKKRAIKGALAMLLLSGVLVAFSGCKDSERETVKQSETAGQNDTVGQNDAEVQETLSIDSPAAIERIQYEVVSTDALECAGEVAEKVVLKYAGSTTAEEVLAGMVWEDVDVSLPVDWSCKEIADNNKCFRLHGLQFLDACYKKFAETGDGSYSDLIMEYVLDWVAQSNEVTEVNEWMWHDDATAMRVIRMSYYYYLFGAGCSEAEQKLIENSLQQQAQLLMTEHFYTEKHNHGMHQDLALIIYALLIAEEKEEYIATALARTGEYLDYVYTEDGVHKEHSPSYAADMLYYMEKFGQLTALVSPDFYAKLEKVTSQAETYLIQVIKPDGYWPSIGDGHYRLVNKNNIQELKENSNYMYVVTNGEQGERPEDDVIFPEGGYAIMRSSWDDAPEDATWMMFLASTFGDTHKHSDDLSFLLYHKGDLFVEGGKRDYNYSDEQTAWAYSSYAHNVLLVNGEGFPVMIMENSGRQQILPEALETGISDYDFSGNVKSVTGVQKRYDNVEQYRTLSYDKENGVVTVADKLDAAERIDATLLYHIAENVTVEECENGWNLYREDALVASVAVEGDSVTQLRTVTEEEGEYPYCTWIFNGKTEAAYGSLLMVDAACEAGNNEIVMTIHLY
ncbi:MAG: alginate lyase family protein [Roseburia sp.]|nr:alginate lyase family protein [Roseburia sp.]